MFGNNVTYSLLVLIFGVLLECKVVTCVTVSRKHFSLLGQSSQIVPTTQDNQQKAQNSTLKTSYYLLSQNAAGWSTSANDCKNLLHETSTLLNIESEEELSKLNTMFKNSDDTGSTYWTGGKYDVNKKQFVWGDGREISSTLWDEGHPVFQVPIARVLAYTVEGLKLQTTFATQSLRYICKYTELTVVETCEC